MQSIHITTVVNDIAINDQQVPDNFQVIQMGWEYLWIRRNAGVTVCIRFAYL